MGYTLKGRDVDKLEAIAKKLGKSYAEVFAEIVGRAHEQMFGTGDEGAPKPEAKTPGDAGDSSAKGDAREALDRIGEPHDGHQLEDSSNEIQDAPDAAGEPNPLAIHPAKRWASASSSNEDEDEDEERDRDVAKQRRVAAQGRPQRK